jgi:hypothetical protein
MRRNRNRHEVFIAGDKEERCAKRRRKIKHREFRRSDVRYAIRDRGAQFATLAWTTKRPSPVPPEMMAVPTSPRVLVASLPIEV